MAARSRPKDGALLRAFAPAVHVLTIERPLRRECPRQLRTWPDDKQKDDKQKARDFARAFAFRFEGAVLRSPCHPCRRRPASPEPRSASSALRRPWPPW